MVDTKELRAQMYRNKCSIKTAADAIGVTANTMYIKMKSGKFTVDEAEKLIALLDLQEPAAIFFAAQVT